MKRFYIFKAVLFLCCSLYVFNTGATAQKSNTETFTGTVLSYGSGLNTRTVTAPFTLIVNGQTSDEQARRFLGFLQEGGQDTLQRGIRNEELGKFSVNARVGPSINVVRESLVDGKRRIFIVFERWMQFAELRGGYRSTDYPFGVIELFIDPKTGKGEGTYVAAAKIRWDRDDKNNQGQVEIENFATFPARLLGVTSSNKTNR